MRLQHPYCVVNQAFSGDFCRRVIETGEATETMTAEVARDPTNSVRDSVVAWVRQSQDTEWLYGAVAKLVEDTNARLWNWRITMPESMQFTHYGPGQHYGWHTDQRRKPYPADDSRWPGLLRKLTVVISLSQASEYEGGEFMLEILETPPDVPEKRLKALPEVRDMGAAIIFPSHLYHQVTPVTAGSRRSLVAWFVGPPFT